MRFTTDIRLQCTIQMSANIPISVAVHPTSYHYSNSSRNVLLYGRGELIRLIYAAKFPCFQETRASVTVAQGDICKLVQITNLGV